MQITGQRMIQVDRQQVRSPRGESSPGMLKEQETCVAGVSE